MRNLILCLILEFSSAAGAGGAARERQRITSGRGGDQGADRGPDRGEGVLLRPRQEPRTGLQVRDEISASINKTANHRAVYIYFYPNIQYF